jgi:hypothetical protein
MPWKHVAARRIVKAPPDEDPVESPPEEKNWDKLKKQRGETDETREV